MIAVFSVFCLVCIAVSCLFGILSERFHENWSEFIGMSAITYWCIVQIPLVYNSSDPSLENVFLYVGLMFFCASSLQKIIVHKDVKTRITEFTSNWDGVERRHHHAR